MPKASQNPARNRAKQPIVDLTGRSPYHALALCMGAARRAGWTEAQIRAFRLDATSADLGHVLKTCRARFAPT